MIQFVVEKLKRFCILPKWKIEIERKKGHVVYWEWVSLDGKRSISLPQNKLGKWELFVDVISPDGATNSFPSQESENALNILFEAAKIQGFNESGESQYESCEINLQNGKLRFRVTRVLTDDGFVPQLKIEYSDNDDFIRSVQDVNLNSTKDLSALSEMFANAVKLKGE